MQIRYYLADLLKTEVDVGNRVFTNRRSALFKEELPAICIEYGAENNEVIDGDKFHARSYLKEQAFTVIIAVEEALEDGKDPMQNANGQDSLDILGQQVEQAIHEDWRLAKRLSGYDANTNYTGLANGSRLIGGDTYEPEARGERKILVRGIGLVVYYDEQSFRDPRLYPFEEYGFEFEYGDDEGTGGGDGEVGQ